MTREEAKEVLISTDLWEELPNGKLRFKEELVNDFSYRWVE